ncbi:MAG TPA: hypothetical protein VH481_09060 [Nitrososphaeraceae archaeon]
MGALLYNFAILDLSLVYAEDVISIIPGSANYDPSSQFSITRFFDNNFFPIKKNNTLTWYNADNVEHTILLSFKNGSSVIKPQTIEPEGSFSHAFINDGYYNFSSAKYNWMKGSVYVTDDIISKTVVDRKNNAKIQLSWTPAKPTVNSNLHFKINFIDMATGKNMQHIDYEFYLLDPNGKEVFKKSMHSGWGVETASYIIPDNLNYSVIISIKGILFQPVESKDARFMIST